LEDIVVSKDESEIDDKGNTYEDIRFLVKK
jgi:hypothetical protein